MEWREMDDASVMLAASPKTLIGILVFGAEVDIPAAVGFVDPVRSYPAVLQSLMSVDFPEQGATVINEGLGGRRARDDVERLPGVLETYKPEGLLILHGYNDLLNDGLGAVDSDTTTLSFTGPTRPAVLTGKRDAEATEGVPADYRYLLMPVRLSG